MYLFYLSEKMNELEQSMQRGFDSNFEPIHKEITSKFQSDWEARRVELISYYENELENKTAELEIAMNEDFKYDKYYISISI